ncbi:hypothetical protein [Pontibacter rugosus]|uniref:Uncharacterized protein n=1 Tax=Pontibacter rugosus TaxID=1745966 RepID=A0ABW3SRA3_9BACT
MSNSKSNLVLQRIKGSLQHTEQPLPDPAAPSVSSTLETGGFRQLYRVLEEAKADMDFDRRAVYIDDESAEVLDLLRKKAKIKSSHLVSFLLHEFFSRHKGLIQELVEKRSNRLID